MFGQKNLAVLNKLVTDPIILERPQPYEPGLRGGGSLEVPWELGRTGDWFEHPTLGRKVDVAMRSVDNGLGIQVIKDDLWERENIRQSVGSELVVPGYPLGIEAGGTPIWKRATMASELQIDCDDLPKMLIDTTSNKGMSGSPVLLKSTQGVTHGGMNVIRAPYTVLTGVYSGRVNHETGPDAQLGVVWKRSALELN